MHPYFSSWSRLRTSRGEISTVAIHSTTNSIHPNQSIHVSTLLKFHGLYIGCPQVQELRGNIRVFCRCRYDSRGRCGLEFDGEDRIICTTAQGRKKVFEFERVYDPKTQQEKVFDDTKPTITSCADGYNVCIIAYGQTGSGKTYTMTGPRENPGVNLR